MLSLFLSLCQQHTNLVSALREQHAEFEREHTDTPDATLCCLAHGFGSVQSLGSNSSCVSPDRPDLDELWTAVHPLLSWLTVRAVELHCGDTVQMLETVGVAGVAARACCVYSQCCKVLVVLQLKCQPVLNCMRTNMLLDSAHSPYRNVAASNFLQNSP